MELVGHNSKGLCSFPCVSPKYSVGVYFRIKKVKHENFK